MNSAQMKTTEPTKLLWRAVNESDRMPLSEAEQPLYTAIHLAVMACEDEVRLGRPAPERRCMICGVLVSQLVAKRCEPDVPSALIAPTEREGRDAKPSTFGLKKFHLTGNFEQPLAEFLRGQ